jgi:hypothetical protein
VQRLLVERLGGVQPAAWQVQGVARLEYGVELGRSGRGGGDLLGPAGPRLALERVDEDRLVYPPPLASGRLQHEDGMRVVVGSEPTAARWGEVGVDLYRGTEVGLQPAGQLDHGRPQPVQPLQYQRRAGVEQRENAFVEHLVADLRPGAAAAGVLGGRHHDAAFRQA